ncbi:response regulator [Herbaspirillum robiniae]|uniref:Histidine kinase n=1 Tax=Herbaspirillum robiniae TaxID=2014887 RepID=A0A2D0B630_9BURK|nr:response regulator [Herbaspirillum robiniae]NUU01850.1 response regulator [Herbaspirillum robiniae]OWY29773.1 histidine kinase [Herbaspirillum robiniae]
MPYITPKVLVIDSNLDAIELARFALWRSDLACRFEWFDDAELANASLLTHALCRSKDLPALILLDPRNFPGAEGYELLRTLCIYEAVSHIPLVLFTSSPLSSDFSIDQDSRIWYAAKSADPADYMREITRCVRSRLYEPVH